MYYYYTHVQYVKYGYFPSRGCPQLEPIRGLVSLTSGAFGALALLTMTTTKLDSWMLYSLRGVESFKILPTERERERERNHIQIFSRRYSQDVYKGRSINQIHT